MGMRPGKSAYNQVNSDNGWTSIAIGKGESVRNIIIVAGLVILLCAQSGIASARDSHNQGKGHGRELRPYVKYSHTDHSSMEAVCAVLAFAQTLLNDDDAACPPPCPQPMPAYYPVQVAQPQPVYYPVHVAHPQPVYYPVYYPVAY